jgi:hypothetical protein
VTTPTAFSTVHARGSPTIPIHACALSLQQVINAVTLGDPDAIAELEDASRTIEFGGRLRSHRPGPNRMNLWSWRGPPRAGRYLNERWWCGRDRLRRPKLTPTCSPVPPRRSSVAPDQRAFRHLCRRASAIWLCGRASW